MLLQVILQALPQCPRPLSVNHKNLGQPRKYSVVDKLPEDGLRFKYGHTTHVNLRANLCRFLRNRRSHMHLGILLLFFPRDKCARTHLDDGTQSTHLNSEFLALNRQDSSLLCKTFDIDNIAAPNILGADCFSDRQIFLQRIMNIRLVQSVSCLLNRLAPLLHPMIVKLFLERLDRFFCAATRFTNNVVRLFARLMQKFLPRI